MIEIIGGEEFELQTEGNFYISHNGNRTFSTLFLTESEVENLKLSLEKFKTEVKFFKKEKNNKEKNILLGKVWRERSIPYSECSSCPFMSVFTKTMCSIDEWDTSMIRGVIQKNPEHKNKLLSCPGGKRERLDED